MIEKLVDGGYMMVPLVICSVLALSVLIDRAVAFYKNGQVDVRSLRAKVLEMLDQGRDEEALQLCQSTPSPVSAVMMVGIQSYIKHRDLNKRPESITAIMEKAMDDYAEHAMSSVEKRLNVLSTIAMAAPLLGMCGTVIGMITSFEAMRTAKDTTGPEVASGISEALITTAAGLIIALFALIPNRIFVGMADRIDLEIDEASSELMDFVATKTETGQQATA